jgi:16S rRNA G527 N7-methylase RsmG
MRFNDIDWNKVWADELAATQWPKLSVKRWNERAAEFNQVKNRVDFSDTYTRQMLEFIEVCPEDTVIDIGCGPGTLAIPLAKKVKSVTALDISAEMLRYVAENARESGLDNINCVNMGWEDVKVGENLEPHDIVLISRCLIRDNNYHNLSSYDTLARKGVYLTYPLVHNTTDEHIYKYMGKSVWLYPPYICVYNMLYQMGIYANVNYISYQNRTAYQNYEEALATLHERLGLLSEKEEELLAEYVKEYFHWKNGMYTYKRQSVSTWALLWWRKD